LCTRLLVACERFSLLLSPGKALATRPLSEQENGGYPPLTSIADASENGGDPHPGTGFTLHFCGFGFKLGAMRHYRTKEEESRLIQIEIKQVDFQIKMRPYPGGCAVVPLPVNRRGGVNIGNSVISFLGQRAFH
jgi:hypothetical protein